jgi:sugar lactone lactonase YvrE
MRLQLVVGAMGVAAVVATGAFAVSGGGTITTFAGTGEGGFSGDGGPATSAHLNYPKGMAVDGQGNVYIADTRNLRVRKVSLDGRITTIAGNGRYGSSGDGGPATSAQLYYPVWLAVDGQGNVYIADARDEDLITHVRKVSPGGTITTFAGTGARGFSGDGGPATSAQLESPGGLAVDRKGNVYIADGSRVRKVDPGGTITTFAGTGRWGFSGDGGPATSAQLKSPKGVAVDGKGNVYIADSNNLRVRKVDPGGTITTFAGTGSRGFSGDGGPATSAQLNYPWGLAVDGKGNVYIADGSSRVRKVSVGGTITTFAGTGIRGSSGDGGLATSAQLNYPSGLAVDRQGNVYIADAYNHRVRKVGDVSAPAVSSLCSRAAARQVVERLHLGDAGDPNLSDSVGQVLCGAFVGPRSRAMVVSLAAPSCGRTAGWVVFRWAGGAWRLVMTRNNGADLAAVGSDIRETMWVLRPRDAHCFPTGGMRARIWHWNGTHFTASTWKQVTKG